MTRRDRVARWAVAERHWWEEETVYLTEHIEQWYPAIHGRVQVDTVIRLGAPRWPHRAVRIA